MIVDDTRRSSSPIVTVPDWYAKIKQTVNLSWLMSGLQRGNPLFGEKASALPEGGPSMFMVCVRVFMFQNKIGTAV